MKNTLSLLTALLVFSLMSIEVTAQGDCSNDRYIKKIYSQVDIIKDVKYGENLTRTNSNQELFFDVYHAPDNDEALRPVVLLAHGGFFAAGAKDGGDVVPICDDLAQRGYVAISMSYRLGINVFSPDSVGLTTALFRAYQDLKAMIRYLKKDVVENGNSYRIDTNAIILGGVSAGGFMMNHYQYLDEVSKIPSFLDTNAVGLSGGLEGISGNPGYSSKAGIGIINIAGALYDTSWIDNSNIVPMLSLHGTLDGTVPYGTGMVKFLNLFDIVRVHGSSSLHQRFDNLGADNCMRTFEGSCHVPHTCETDSSFLDTTLAYVSKFTADLICEQKTDCSMPEFPNLNPDLSNNTLEVNTISPIVFINHPSSGELQLKLQSNVLQIQVFTIEGRLVVERNPRSSYENISLSAGMYIVSAHTAEGNRFTHKALVH